MKAIANHKELVELLMKDAKSAGVRILINFIYSMLNPEIKTVILEGAGHFPIEEPGLKQMEKVCVRFLEEHRWMDTSSTGGSISRMTVFPSSSKSANAFCPYRLPRISGRIQKCAT